MADPYKKRRETDLEKLKQLITEYNNLIEMINVNELLSSIKLRINAPTAGSSDYPNIKRHFSEIQIDLPSNYPFKECKGPKVLVLTQIWNPNIYSSGSICLGEWHPTDTLNLTLERVIKVITFDDQVINIKSPANKDAKEWYINAKSKYPSAFPSIKLTELKKTVTKPTMSWRTLEQAPEISIVNISCPTCAVKLKITLSDKNKRIRCPKCKTVFHA